MVKSFKSSEDFAKNFPEFVEIYSTQLMVEFHKANHHEGRRLLQRELTAASVSGDLASSLRDSAAGQGEFLAALGIESYVHPDQLKEPGATRIISLDKGFHAVDSPRNTVSNPYRYGTHKGSRRRLGTDRAPRGFTTPAQQKLLAKSRQDQLLEEAAKKAWPKAVAATQ